MAEKTAIRAVIRVIDHALKAFVENKGPSHVDVFESSGPYLRALVVSDCFRGVQATTRQIQVWDHLKHEVDVQTLNKLWGVHPYTWEEYDTEFEQSSSSADPGRQSE